MGSVMLPGANLFWRAPLCSEINRRDRGANALSYGVALSFLRDRSGVE